MSFWVMFTMVPVAIKVCKGATNWLFLDCDHCDP